MIEVFLALIFGPPLLAGLVALLFADVWLARIDREDARKEEAHAQNESAWHA